MIFAYKKTGETPLEMLERLRWERPELKDEILSYAGRLDPMAEGKMLVVVGDENKEREKYLNLDKEYTAEFIAGVKTDTGDALGILENSEYEKVSRAEIRSSIEKLKNVKKQRYPWFSGKTVGGIKLFDHYKSGNTDVKRPVFPVEIKEAEFLSLKEVPAEDIRAYIFQTISKVRGDFRQKAILEKWGIFFDNIDGKSANIMESSHSRGVVSKTHSRAQTVFSRASREGTSMTVFSARFRVSGGTFIRALTEELPFPAVLLKLKRTEIYTDSLHTG